MFLICFLLILFQLSLRVAWRVTDANPASSQLNWVKECTVVNARTSQSTSKSTSTLTEDLDFGRNFQSGDGLTTTCQLKQSPVNFRTTTVIAEATSSSSMGSTDKTETLTFTSILVNIMVSSLTIPQTNPDTARFTWTKSCTATTTRSGVTLTDTKSGLADSVTSVDFGRVFVNKDSVVLTCDLQETFSGTTTTLSPARATTTVAITDATDKNEVLNYGVFMVILKFTINLI